MICAVSMCNRLFSTSPMGMKFSPNVSRNDWLRFTKGKGEKNTSAAGTPFQTKTVLPNRLWTLWMFGIFSVFKLDITWLTRSHWLVDHWQKMTSSACSKFLQRAQKGLKFSSALWLNSSTTTQKHFTRIYLGWSHWGATRRWHSRPHLASQKSWRSGLIFGELRIPSDWLAGFDLDDPCAWWTHHKSPWKSP